MSGALSLKYGKMWLTILSDITTLRLAIFFRKGSSTSANCRYRGIPFRNLRKLGRFLRLGKTLQYIVKVVNLFQDHFMGPGYSPGIAHEGKAYWNLLFVLHDTYAAFTTWIICPVGIQHSEIIGLASKSYIKFSGLWHRRRLLYFEDRLVIMQHLLVLRNVMSLTWVEEFVGLRRLFDSWSTVNLDWQTCLGPTVRWPAVHAFQKGQSHVITYKVY
jgi:hypothetical protein